VHSAVHFRDNNTPIHQVEPKWRPVRASVYSMDLAGNEG